MGRKKFEPTPGRRLRPPPTYQAPYISHTLLPYTPILKMPPQRRELNPQLRSRICELRSIGWGPKKIHDKHPEIPINTIKTTIRREHERENNQSKPRSGRPQKLNEDQCIYIHDTVTSNPHTKYEELLDGVDHVVKKRSIQNLLHESNLRKWIQLSRPKLTPQHASQRLEWAKRYESFTSNDWAQVKWSDECTVERGIGKRPIWTFTKPSNQIRLRDVHTKPCGKGIKQMFWAAFGASIRTGLIPLDGDPDAQRGGVTARIISILYQSFLPDLLQPGDIFMHDNAPVHTAGIVQEVLNELGVNVMIWPPHSPDLNPIENLWALMKQKIYELYPELEHAPNTETSKRLLVQAAQEAWHAIEDRVLVSLSESMPNRVHAVIDANGWYTDY